LDPAGHTVNFPAKVTVATAGFVGVALTLIFLLWDSDEKLVENLLEQGAKAAGRGDGEGVIALVSRSYRSGQEDYEAAVKRIHQALAQRVGVVELVGSAIEVIGAEAGATARVRVTAGPRVLREFALKLKLRKEEGGWRVTSAEELR
jgi:hypothetical protein